MSVFKTILFMVLLSSSCTILLSQNAMKAQYTIPFYRTAANVVEIDVKVNDYSQRFIFDTGASNLSFGKDFYEKLIRGGRLTQSDVIANTKITMADGSLVNAKMIRVSRLNIGKILLYDIDATVIMKDGVPFLIGQSVFNQFGSILIDNDNDRIILKKMSKLNLNEIRFIPCSKEVVYLADIYRNQVSSSSKFQINNFTLENNIPPDKARNKIQQKLTIRFFALKDYKSALALKQELIRNGHASAEIAIEDMTSRYNVEFNKYIEIWIK